MTPETKTKFREAMSAAWAWLKAHPKTLQAVGWFLLGFVVGKML